MTRLQDAENAIETGADALGFVFWSPSKRFIPIQDAANIVDRVSAYVSTVAVFVDPTEAEVRAVLDHVEIDSLQFHGQEPVDFCTHFDRPFVKTLSMREDLDVSGFCRQYPQAKGVLLDTYQAGTPGGTGEQFRWQWIPEQLSLPVILAGGLTAENIAQAIHHVRPYAVDVSSGVESAPGRKNVEKLKALVRAVRYADLHEETLASHSTGEQS